MKRRPGIGNWRRPSSALNQTKRQAERLERILADNDESTRGRSVKEWKVLLKEGDELISNTEKGDVRDAG